MLGILNAKLHGIDLNTSTSLPVQVWVTSVLIHIPYMMIISWLYFSGARIQASWREGRDFAVALVAFSFGLDLLIIGLSVINGTIISDLSAYYGSIWLWVTLVITAGVPIGVGALYRSRKNV